MGDGFNAEGMRKTSLRKANGDGFNAEGMRKTSLRALWLPPAMQNRQRSSRPTTSWRPRVFFRLDDRGKSRLGG